MLSHNNCLIDNNSDNEDNSNSTPINTINNSIKFYNDIIANNEELIFNPYNNKNTDLFIFHFL